MIDGYDSKSCNVLQRPYYKPVEAAIRWCGLIQHEHDILQELGEASIPKAGQFPLWPCLRLNTLKIVDGIDTGNLPYGREGKPVAPGEQVSPSKRTVRHADLRQWMARSYPDNLPAFLLDETERNARGEIGLAYLDPNHPRYAPKLAAAVRAWLAVDDPPAGKTAKQSLVNWLRENAPELGLTGPEGKPNELGIDECAKVANWRTDGGAPKTPGA